MKDYNTISAEIEAAADAVSALSGWLQKDIYCMAELLPVDAPSVELLRNAFLAVSFQLERLAADVAEIGGKVAAPLRGVEYYFECDKASK